MTIGDYSQIDDFVFLNCGVRTTLGRFVHIASFCSIVGGGEFEMGDFSGLSAGCRIITGSDDFAGGALTNPTIPPEFTNVKRSSVNIGRHAIIGTNAIVFPGVTIPEGAAVGAGCVVRHSLEPWTIYAGVDCRRMRARRADKILAMEVDLLSRLERS